jgi:hypothetical protein
MDDTAVIVNVVMPGLIENIVSRSRIKMLNGWVIHLDDAGPRNSRSSSECIRASKAERLPRPVYSPEIVSNDFLVLGYIKGKCLTAMRRADLLKIIAEISSEIDRIMLISSSESRRK